MITRRVFALGAAALGCGAADAQGLTDAQAVGAVGKPRLPFPVEALAPQLSADTVRTHFAGHHLGYYHQVLNLNSLAGQSLTSIIEDSATTPALAALHTAACQLFNHNLYWQSLRAPKAEAMPPILAGRIERDFGGLPLLHNELLTAANSHPGPGWLWLLVSRGGTMTVRALPDNQSPIKAGQRPLLAIDLWEHAYYLDYRHRRSAYLRATLDLLNWPFAEAMLLASSGQAIKA